MYELLIELIKTHFSHNGAANITVSLYICSGEWLDILWCSVCLCLTFVTFFVKKYLFSAYQL